MTILSDQEKKTIEDIVAGRGKELIDIVVKRNGRTLIIEVVADNPQGGIKLDECVQLNRDIGDSFEQSNFMGGGDYTIEVSSPGIDRPLKSGKDFKRVIGRKIRCHVNVLVQGKLEHVGQLANVNENEIVLNVKKGTVSVPLNLIQTAVQII